MLFAPAFACWVLGHHAYIAATPNKQKAFGIGWSLGRTGEAGYLLVLLAGLAVGNLAPRAAAWFRDAARSELLIKTGIVGYGAVRGVKAAEEPGEPRAVIPRGPADELLASWPFRSCRCAMVSAFLAFRFDGRPRTYRPALSRVRAARGWRRAGWRPRGRFVARICRAMRSGRPDGGL